MLYHKLQNGTVSSTIWVIRSRVSLRMVVSAVNRMPALNFVQLLNGQVGRPLSDAPFWHTLNEITAAASASGVKPFARFDGVLEQVQDGVLHAGANPRLTQIRTAFTDRGRDRHTSVEAVDHPWVHI